MKVHLGCGDKRLPGFVHVDARQLDGIDRVATADKLPFENNSVELLYWCHGLEHIPRVEVNQVLQEIRRVLVTNGILRLSMPDLSVLAQIYVSKIVGIESVIGAIHGGQEYQENLHYCSYDFQSLSKLLKTSGYSDIGTYRPEIVNPDGYNDYSYYRIGGELISLNVEATKGFEYERA